MSRLINIFVESLLVSCTCSKGSLLCHADFSSILKLGPLITTTLGCFDSRLCCVHPITFGLATIRSGRGGFRHLKVNSCFHDTWWICFRACLVAFVCCGLLLTSTLQVQDS